MLPDVYLLVPNSLNQPRVRNKYSWKCLPFKGYPASKFRSISTILRLQYFLWMARLGSVRKKSLKRLPSKDYQASKSRHLDRYPWCNVIRTSSLRVITMHSSNTTLSSVPYIQYFQIPGVCVAIRGIPIALGIRFYSQRLFILNSVPSLAIHLR